MTFSAGFPRVFRPAFGPGLAGAAAGGAANGLLNNIVAYWKLDETSGTRYDAHGGNDLSVVGSVGSVAGKINSAADFTPYSAANYLTRSALIFGDADFTFAAWVRALSVSDSFTQTIVSCGDPNSDPNGTLYHFGSWSGSTALTFLVGNGSSYAQKTVSAALSLSAWQFVMAWHDSVANTINLQIDNGAVQSAAWSGGSKASTSYPTRVGTCQNHGRRWNGYIDEAGIWSAVLTSDQKTALYNAGAGLAYANFTT